MKRTIQIIAGLLATATFALGLTGAVELPDSTPDHIEAVVDTVVDEAEPAAAAYDPGGGSTWYVRDCWKSGSTYITKWLTKYGDVKYTYSTRWCPYGDPR